MNQPPNPEDVHGISIFSVPKKWRDVGWLAAVGLVMYGCLLAGCAIAKDNYRRVGCWLLVAVLAGAVVLAALWQR